MDFDAFSKYAANLMKSLSGTAALAVVALKNYSVNKGEGKRMLTLLKGPAGFGGTEEQFIKERLGEGKENYIVDSYLKSTNPKNGYTPEKPYIRISKEEKIDEGYFRVYLISTGADSPRPVLLRLKPSEGMYYLNEANLLLGQIRKPLKDDKWA